jgi:hypothetical protein
MLAAVDTYRLTRASALPQKVVDALHESPNDNSEYFFWNGHCLRTNRFHCVQQSPDSPFGEWTRRKVSGQRGGAQVEMAGECRIGPDL